jgi:hypothetical protein
MFPENLLGKLVTVVILVFKVFWLKKLEPSAHGKDITLPHAEFTTPVYKTHHYNRQSWQWVLMDCPEPPREHSLICSCQVTLPFQTA